MDSSGFIAVYFLLSYEIILPSDFDNSRLFLLIKITYNPNFTVIWISCCSNGIESILFWSIVDHYDTTLKTYFPYWISYFVIFRNAVQNPLISCNNYLKCQILWRNLTNKEFWIILFIFNSMLIGIDLWFDTVQLSSSNPRSSQLA